MNEIRVLPQLTIVKASAGSGKTYFLTKTYVELLLSDSINYNDLRNILAITFSNNASIEIKEKIIKWLKDIYYGKNEAVREFSHLNISTDEIIKKAENIIDKILNNYSEFQVRTIDSFLTKIFKAEAVSFGYYGDFQILSRIDRFLHRSFEIFLNQLNESSELIDYIKKLIKLIEETLPADSTYLWNPTLRIFKMLKNLYSVVSKSNESFIENNIYEKIKLYLNEFEQAKDKLTEIANELYRAIQTHEKGFHKGSRLPKILEKIRNKDYSEILNASCQSLPLTKPSQEIKKLWESFKKAEATFLKYYSKTYCIPYLLIFISFYETLWKLKIREQKIFIDDINSLIRDRIDYLSIPEVYLKLGERIYHYLTDEFQDTSPVQWQNLKALIENSLSEGGSLLLVGDTKQAVYGFRGADYTIMADMISEANKPNHFPSVKAYKILNLYNNFRSGEKIIDFVKDFFQKKLKEYLQEESDKKHLFNKDKIPLPLRLSGLYECQQQVREDLKGIGFVKIEKIEYQEEKENTQKEALI